MRVGRHNAENLANDQDYLSYLQGKGLAATSVAHYLRLLRLFLDWTDKDVAAITAEDIIAYLAHLKQKYNQQNTTRSNALIALNHYFTYLYKNEAIPKNPCLLIKIRGAKKNSLHKIFSLEELEELFDSFYNSFVHSYDDSRIKVHNRQHAALSRQRNAVMLSLLIHQGVTTKELERIVLDDVDCNKAIIKISGGKKGNSRLIPLKAVQMGILIQYQQHTRPHFFDFYKIESDRLFLPLPEIGRQYTESENLMGAFKVFSRQVNEINKSFLNFKQIRASVIANWLKTEGLRKTQYLAGHRYISSTEKYLSNNLDGLTDDIARLHPFQ